ncbi:hypothetical protein JXB28_01860 [Candidatus Woesearchaeota archaeon]|nr:hypothetical protein [Candidatus Woesearchaeota archaeon]
MKPTLLELDIGLLEERTGLDFSKYEAEKVVCLRQLENTNCIEAMPKDTLDTLLRNVRLNGKPEEKPYQDADIKVFRIDPAGLYLGQTFVQEEKLLSFMSDFPRVLSNFCSAGISKLYPFIACGEFQEKPAISFYIPPIAESYNGNYVILDGIHRSYLTKQAGTTMTYVVIEKKNNGLPFTPAKWDDIKLVKDKPEIEKRYFNLKKELFRRLDHVGIDG